MAPPAVLLSLPVSRAIGEAGELGGMLGAVPPRPGLAVGTSPALWQTYMVMSTNKAN